MAVVKLIGVGVGKEGKTLLDRHTSDRLKAYQDGTDGSLEVDDPRPGDIVLIPCPLWSALQLQRCISWQAAITSKATYAFNQRDPCCLQTRK